MLKVTQFIPELMELHRKGHFPIERLCKVYPIEKLESALSDLKSGSVSDLQGLVDCIILN